MKNKTKKSLKQLCKESEGGKPEPLTTEHYFTSPIYFTDKPEWVKDLNKFSDPFIKQARKANLNDIKKRNKKFGNKGEHPWLNQSARF